MTRTTRSSSPVNPLAVALAAGGTFIVQSFSSDAQRHTKIVQQAVEHDDFVNVYSPCVTFNDVDTCDYFRDSIVGLQESDHDNAKDAALNADKEYQDIIYRDENSIPWEQREGLTESMADIPDGTPDDAMDLVGEFY